MAVQAFAYAGLAGLQLASGLLQADAIKESARLNRQIAEMNAEFAELDAYDAEIEGYSTVGRYQKVIDDTLARQQLTLTAKDVDVSYGSAASIQKETRFLGELNKMEVINRAEAKAMGYKFQASQYRLGGDLQLLDADVKAGAAIRQSVIGAAKTSISGYAKGAFDDIDSIGPSYSDANYTGNWGGVGGGELASTQSNYLDLI